MKATLEFDMDDSDDRAEHAQMLRARDMSLVLTDCMEDMRLVVKHKEPTPSDTVTEAEHWRSHMITVLSNYGLNPDEL